ncbi:tetratricopeptide repeat protein [Hymenobacter sp. HMF4947]|uniref:histidine kinase n=1 Tax=Hymenobacter ginkgonis TaxID=2682976 RepID=A0A7K1TB87_9BACT|nr:ATP-binding protein [Hymenobacter ginkgonis]MVN75668.1 tetratricopeptide repeat protein [Hymenobacter ginkgonis]
MNRSLLLACLWLLAPAAWSAPTPTVRQLWQQLRQHPQADTFRVNRLNKLADYRSDEDGFSPARNDSLARQALTLAQRLHYVYGEAYAQYNVVMAGAVPTSKRQFQARLLQVLPLAERSGDKPLLVQVLQTLSLYSGEQGLAYIQRALTVARTTGQPLLVQRCYWTQAGYFKTVVGNYYLALQALQQALRVTQQAHLPDEEADALGSIGGLYIDMADYEQAIKYLLQSFTQAKALPESSRKRVLESEALYSIGECYRLTGRQGRAQAAYREALLVSRSTFLTMAAQSGLADSYERQGNAQTLPFARHVLAETYGAPHEELRRYARMRVYLTLGRYFLRQGPADSAIIYSQKGLQLAQRFLEKEPVRDALLLLAQASARRHAYAAAYAYQRRYLGLRDTLSNEQITRQATAARFTQNLAQQQSQIALLQKDKLLQVEQARRQRLLLGATLVGLVLLSSLGFGLWRYTRQQQQANTRLHQQRDQTRRALRHLRATQQQLIQREKMASLGELTAGIAHEIQNPLNFVTNFADVSAELCQELQQEAQAGHPDNVVALADDLTQNLTKISQYGQRAAGIVRGMLDHARPSNGERQPTDLNALCHEYLRLAYQGLRSKDPSFEATIQTKLAPALPRATVSESEIGRVLLNLFNNAFYALRQRQHRVTGYQPAVYVSTELREPNLVLTIRDNGIGIPAKIQPKIFQPFFTTKPPGEGTGLGLSLSYDIVTKGHGGTLSVNSHEGEGTEVVLTLPA